MSGFSRGDSGSSDTRVGETRRYTPRRGRDPKPWTTKEEVPTRRDPEGYRPTRYSDPWIEVVVEEALGKS